ncbi:MAG TPA: ATP-binding protein [Planctomycetota bacterium]|jgi:signal transduction histidine kinase|nr:ATP-binding protein [Planctomycetota bacterium]
MVNGIVSRGGTVGELTRLMETFHQATEKLARSYEKIEELQRELADKDRRLARKTRLETLGRMAAGLAHEIRNPLAGIQLYAALLRRELGHDAEKAACLDRILSAVCGLEKLVDDMLTFGRDLEPRRSFQPFGPRVREALDLARAAIEEKKIDVICDLDATPVDLDGEMMRRVFLNLVLNAVEAMPPGGRLSIRSSGRTISFADTGPGIPPEILEKLFTPFVTGKAKGTGLGLAIAHKIVEAHGGLIEARNDPAGGAVFTIRL